MKSTLVRALLIPFLASATPAFVGDKDPGYDWRYGNLTLEAYPQ